MKKRWLLLLGIIGMLFLLCACSSQPEDKGEAFPFDVEGTTEIVLRSGTTGEGVTITDAEEIQSVREMLEKNSYTSEEVEPVDGWTYWMAFQNDEGEVLAELYVVDNGFKWDDIVYHCNGDLGLYEYAETYDEALGVPQGEPFQFDLEGTTEIVLSAGDTDESVTITDAEEIQSIRDMLELTIYNGEEKEPVAGWAYRLTFQNEKGDVLADIFVNSDEGYEYDNILYRSSNSRFELYDRLGKYDEQLGLE
ncbi:MAG: hypothetical protein Q4D42_06625 [Eubacteriales bacterium]|nr:hypothetical protein [Eubacteriales bacterium]